MIASSRRWGLGASIALAVLALAPAARSEPRASALAQVLFEEGVALMGEGHFAEACPKLAESQRLDPGGGTSLNLASCLERLGQLASSYATYSEALSAAIRDGRKEREAIARERLASLQGLMSRLELRVPSDTKGADTKGVVVTLDGTRLGASAWGSSLPIDPGSHTVVVAAEGRAPFERTFDVTGNGQRVVLDVPALAVAPPLPAPPAPRALASQPAAAPVGPIDSGGGRRRAAAVVIAGGATLVVAGGVLGGLALMKKDESDQGCPTATTCSDAGAEAMGTANTLAWGANVAVGVGLIAVATGVVLHLLAPPVIRSARPSWPAAVRF